MHVAAVNRWDRKNSFCPIDRQRQQDLYSKLASTHIFYPFAIETAGKWHEMAIELTQEIGRRIITITEDTWETTYV